MIKFGFDFGILLTSIVRFFGGEFFFITLDIAMGGECKMDAYRKLFYEVLNAAQEDPNDYTCFSKVFNYLYTMGLCLYFSGIILVIIFDYIDKIRIFQNYIFSLVYIAMALLSGGLGFMLFIGAFLEYFGFYRWTNAIVGILILGFGGFASFTGFVYTLFFWKIVSKAYKIAFPICISGALLLIKY